MHGAPFGKLPWQHPPLATALEQVQHRAEHLVQIHRPRLGPPPNTLQQRTNLLEPSTIHITRILLLTHPFSIDQDSDREQVLMIPVKRRPHNVSKRLGSIHVGSCGPTTSRVGSCGPSTGRVGSGDPNRKRVEQTETRLAAKFWTGKTLPRVSALWHWRLGNQGQNARKLARERTAFYNPPHA